MLRWIIAPIALAMVATPAAADNQDKKENAAAVAAIKARSDQLRQDPTARKCLGADAVTCLATLSFGVTVTTEPLWMGGGFKLPKPVEHDIDGRPISQLMEFLVQFGSRDKDLFGPNVLRAQIDLTDGEHVGSVEFFLKHAPLLAQTQADWDNTHIFELATAVLGPACVGTDRLAFYRRYDAMQKQQASREEYRETPSGPRGSSGMFGDTEMCGVSVMAGSIAGVSPGTGSYGGSSISFEIPFRAKR
jgi:hypothetical protein